jgi:outer membrane protein insertion porin family
LPIQLGLVALLGASLPSARAESRSNLELEAAPDLRSFAEEKLAAVQAETEGPLWPERIQLQSVHAGDPATPEVARRAILELTGTHRFAEVRASFARTASSVVLVIRARPRRIVSTIAFEGNRLDLAEAERALDIDAGDDITAERLDQAASALAEAHRAAGYSDAHVQLSPEATDDPMRILLRVKVEAGKADKISERRFLVDPFPARPELGPLLRHFSMQRGDRADQEKLSNAEERLVHDLAQAGFYEARVEGEIRGASILTVTVHSGPLFQLRVEGNQTFDSKTLLGALNLSEQHEVSLDYIESELAAFYQKYGYFDARIRAERHEDKPHGAAEVRIRVIEGAPLQIVRRHYPCLSGSVTARDIDREVDGVLSEHFAQPTLVGPPNESELDTELTGQDEGGSMKPLPLLPYARYSPEAYAAVREHLESLLQAEGYLRAEVRPEILARRVCAPGTQPGLCVAQGERILEPPPCGARPEQRPTPTCQEGPGVRCEPEAEIVLPVAPGPLSSLTDITIEGNDHFTRSELLKALGLKQRQPLRRAELDQALARVRDLYSEAAFAFAEVESSLDVSQDGARVRLLLQVTERKPVRVAKIVIEGARRTRVGLIRKRIALKEGDLFRASLARVTQDRIESLGTFTSVSVTLEDPRVPAREKTVIVSVSERLPQYLDLKGGLSTGDGFRVGFEYGHRNLGREAIQFTIRSQLGIRPPFLIVEPDVRARYQKIELAELLERRNSVSLSLPETGLGPLFRGELEALDLRDNQRDFSQTRDALTARVLFRPARPWTFSLGASVERNDVYLFALATDQGSQEDLEDLLNQANVRVPQGVSAAFAQELNGTWDRRDRPLSPTRGTILGATVEHVTAVPVETNAACTTTNVSAFDPTCSELFRFSGRAGVYVPFGKHGWVLALGLKGGFIQHLVDYSHTYPDRLFFMGGVDTLRGFPQDSVVPEDVAQALLAPNSELTINDVVLRGGDVFINPRAELRIPIGGNLETALFIDSGNLWANRDKFNAFTLRYAIGTGIRYQTPIGPLVFDYGFNLDRVLDALFPDRPNQRTWEAIGAFHFSIGYF